MKVIYGLNTWIINGRDVRTLLELFKYILNEPELSQYLLYSLIFTPSTKLSYTNIIF